MENNDDIPLLINDCLARKSKMNTWECEFIDSISQKDPSILTEKQTQRLEIIWEKVTG